MQSEIDALINARIHFTNEAPFIHNTAARGGMKSQALPAELISSSGQLLTLREPAMAGKSVEISHHIRLALPGLDGDTLVLLLFEKSPTSADFRGANGSAPALGRFYRGVVEGRRGSLVSISVFKDEWRGLISMDDETHVLGKLRDGSDGVHILYRADALQLPNEFSCESLEHPDMQAESKSDQKSVSAPMAAKCVRIRAEVDAGLNASLGGSAAAEQYVLGLFNEITTLFDNDGIDVALSEIIQWTGSSPYTPPLSSMLYQMSNTSSNADLTALLTNVGGGGIAFLNGLCSSSWGKSVNNLYGYHYGVPTYSWDVNVCAHEIGHNLSSPHTHACSWNGNNTPLDGCGIQAGYAEGNCGTASIPSTGGTIMSYCHIFGVGINFNKGFGEQPRTRMSNYINSRPCLGSACSTVTEPEPEPCTLPYPQVDGLIANSTPNGIQLSWNPIIGSLGCQIRGGLVGTSQLQTVEILGSDLSAYNVPVASLPVNGTYRFQVRCGCSKNPPVIGPWSPFISTLGGTAAMEQVALQGALPANDAFKIYPNPAQSNVTIEFYSAEEGFRHVQLLDAMGRVVFAERRIAQMGEQQFEFDLPLLPQGVYIVQLRQPDGSVLSTRLMIAGKR